MVELVRDMGVTLVQSAASDEMVAMAAWVSNDADNEERLRDEAKVAGLIKFLYRNQHMSPFEHGHFTFKVDVPLFVAREFHRHRAASYNEVSGRYTEMKPRFYVGEYARVQQGKMGDYYFVPGSDEQTALYLKSKEAVLDKVWAEYQKRLEAGIAKEQAREDLPLSLMTQFYVTMNPRNLMHFLELRTDKHALKEIRDVASLMEQIFAQEMPLTYAAYSEELNKDKVDVKTLQDKINELEGRLHKAELRLELKVKEVKDLEQDRRWWINKYEELKTVSDEAVFKYNAEFDPNDRVHVTDHGLKFDDLVDYVVPRAAQAVERLKPVYNIYVDSKGLDAEDITKRVQAVLERYDRKRRR